MTTLFYSLPALTANVIVRLLRSILLLMAWICLSVIGLKLPTGKFSIEKGIIAPWSVTVKHVLFQSISKISLGRFFQNTTNWKKFGNSRLCSQCRVSLFALNFLPIVQGLQCWTTVKCYQEMGSSNISWAKNITVGQMLTTLTHIITFHNRGWKTYTRNVIVKLTQQ